MTVAVHGTQQQQQPPASEPNPDRNGVLPPHGSLGLPNNGTQQQPSTSSAPIPISAAPPNPQQSGSSAQESNPGPRMSQHRHRKLLKYHRLLKIYQGFYYAPWQYSNQVIPWYPPNQAAMFQPEQMLWPPYLLRKESFTGND
uniref:(northern house mosquito) hypothetical protein n=1 Tax=Culex pipiens TaxID=7175 RepID=A0A8D8D4U8_CULPI